MAKYQRQEFVNNSTTLTAEHLNHIEDGIVANEKAIEEVNKKIPADYAPSDHTHSEYATNTQVDELSNQIVNEETERKNAIQTLSEEIVDLKENGGSGSVDLTNYYTKDKVYNKEEIDTKLGGEVDILPKQDLTFEENAYMQEKTFGLVAGNVYTVEFDGMFYVCECSTISVEGQTVVYIGNGANLGGTNNDMPFVIADNPSYNAGMIGAFTEGTSHNIRIYTKSTFVTKSEVVSIVDEIINEALNSEV